MADLKPVGSEKLKGDEKLKRILELTYYNEKNKNINESTKPELVKESVSGGVYGIVREKHDYYVKKGLTENTLDYIGGIFMKNKNKFSSYAEALKRLELLKGQEELQEATKYVLKTNKTKEEAPMPEPAMDDMPPADNALPPAPGDEMGGDVPLDEPSDMSGAPEGEMGGESGKRSDYMAEAQKYAGKLGQELRDLHDKMESDDIKYILNMIISAVDLDKLDDGDIEDIAEKFERDEEQGGEQGGEFDFGGDDLNGEEVPSGEGEQSDEELDETINMLDSFINSSLDEYMDEESDDDLMEFDLDEFADLEDDSVDSHSNGYRPEYISPELEMGEQDGENDEEVDEEVELDINKLKQEINDSINTALGKYFK